MIIIDILREIYILFVEMAPYLMLGLLFVGLLNLFMTKDIVSKQIGKDNFSSVAKASLFGIPLPLCSCGVIPSSVYLAKNGASKGSVVSFLTSTPQTGIDSIIATYGMMGPVFAIFRPFAALIMGLTGGIITRFVNTDKNTPATKEWGNNLQIEEYDQEFGKEKNFGQRTLGSLKYAFFEFLDDISTHFIVGLIIAALITYFIPEGFFDNTGLNNGILGMLILVVIAIPMYVCATASIPIALSLIMKGFSPGVAFVFLAAGPATNAASLTILFKVLGKKATAIYLANIIIFSILFGLLLDKIFVMFNIDPMMQIMGGKHQHDMVTNNEFMIIVSAVFFILLSMSMFRKYIKPKLLKREISMEKENTKKIYIEGMTCNHCVMNVKKAIINTQGVKDVDVVLSDNAAYVEGDFDNAELTKAVEDIGYKVVN